VLDLRVDLGRREPPSAQLVAAVLDAIAGGALAAGDRLPSVRAAAVRALVNPNTVAKAWQELERLGVVAARNGSGIFVLPGGARIAGRLRRGATLDAFADAARSALRAGHEVLALQELVTRIGRAGGDRGRNGDG
jgi:GntR family transcriptional regulator